MGSMESLGKTGAIVGTTTSYAYPSFETQTTKKTSSSNIGSIIPLFFGGLGILIIIIAIHYAFWLILAKLAGFGKENKKTSADKQSFDNQKSVLYYQNTKPAAEAPQLELSSNTNRTRVPEAHTVRQSPVLAKKDTRNSSVKSTSTYEVFDIKPHTKAWNDLHKGRITGSSAFYLKYNSVDSAIRRSDFDNEYTTSNEAIRRTLRLKPIGAAEFAKEYGYDMKTVGFVKSLSYRKAGFSPDGVILGDDGAIESIVCVKAFGKYHHLSCANDIEESIMYQIQFGLFVTNATNAYLVFYNPDIYPANKQMIVKKVSRDEEIISLFKSRFDSQKRKTSTTSAAPARHNNSTYSLLNSYRKV